MARALRKMELDSINVITNALNLAALLMHVPWVRLIVSGGVLRRESNSLSGSMG
jgi:DeoR family transcriptional regulator, aga operon transcriptional repressor